MQAGIDSLAAVDLRRELTTAFKLEPDVLPPTLVFDYPSVEAIAEFLLPLLPPPLLLQHPPWSASDAAGTVGQAPSARLKAAGNDPAAVSLSDEATATDAATSAPERGRARRHLPPINPNAPTLTRQQPGSIRLSVCHAASACLLSFAGCVDAVKTILSTASHLSSVGTRVGQMSRVCQMSKYHVCQLSYVCQLSDHRVSASAGRG